MKQLRDRWPWVLAALGLAFLLVNRGFRSYVRRSLELRSLDRQLAASDKEEAALNVRLKALDKTDSALEREARKNLGYVKPGEVEYRFPRPQ